MSPEASQEFDQPVGNPLPEWSPPPFPEHDIHEGRYCRLEPIDLQRHGRELFAELNPEARNWTYLPYGPFRSEKEFLHWMEETCLDRDPQFYAIVRLSDERALGVWRAT